MIVRQKSFKTKQNESENHTGEKSSKGSTLVLTPLPLRSILNLNPFFGHQKWVLPRADPGFGQGGGPRNFCRDFADVAKRSRASEASQYWPGSRARLRALEALAFLTLKYAFSHFSWYFFFKFFNVHFCGCINKYLFQHERF